VILLSARAGEEARIEGLDAGADDYLHKPFGARELLAHVAARLDQVRARETIRRSEERYRNIFQTAGVSIWEEDFSAVKAALDTLLATGVQDLRGYLAAHPEFVRRTIGLVRILDVNQATLRMFGARYKSELMDSLHKVFVPESEKVFAEELIAIAEQRAAFESEIVLATLQGERRDAVVNIAFPVGESSFDRVLVTVTDITDRKRAEQALREEDRRKDEFLATLSHELRNPLAPLRNSLHLLRLAGQGHGSPAAIQEMMERQVDHLVRLVDDLLEVSRISRGTFELRKQPLDIATIVRHAIETSQPLIQTAGHTLTLTLPEQPLWLEGDPVRLSQILSNLLNNAAKYTPRGGAIGVEVRRAESSVLITVRDNGVGIPPEALPRMFEMFTRGEFAGADDHHGQAGLGIGLALARRLAEMHGGTITAHSEGINQGSEFTVQLRLSADQCPSATTMPRAQAAIGQRRILVVDDNRDAAESLSMILRFLGADVQVAHGGREALDILSTYEPSVVLLDIGMAGMDGYEVARRIRTAFPEQPPTIVALTGWGQEDDRQRARDAGFDHHLIKPADISVLQALLASLR
jgi:PAS domain S-box-containing protein